MITIFANNGKSPTIRLFRGDRLAHLGTLMRGRDSDWQAVSCEASEVRSVLMAAFGIEWFNRARGELAAMGL
ncbi:hypothetical protein [Consotaella salsifontis]|uniref:Uncharacterized protein n=1 Tax=Consotaella salsifontis TaxID=1365950 RepID=A0A1T4SS16_9HYPH|nr:hypothetical protein [Consotaella salsifontis]SKA31100.1 hypothetical protein SAMN05428963_113116 [Consotaella salsifontis]